MASKCMQQETDSLILQGLNITRLNERLDQLQAEEILEWAWDAFGPQVVMSSSFQTQSVPLLHIVSRVCPEMPVVFIDTGFHFAETLTFRDELRSRYDLNVVVVHALLEKSQLLERYGEGLYRRDPDLCCYINKVEPMRRATSEMRAWVAGIRRDQTAHRKALKTLEPQPTGLLKIHPMINWTKRDVWKYIDKYKLPSHPLFTKGYLSIGCVPCTRPVLAGEGERAGRWVGVEKTECGLHEGWVNNGREQNGQSAE
jgi:phosphoadenosine phosphosulfate reductase